MSDPRLDRIEHLVRQMDKDQKTVNITGFLIWPMIIFVWVVAIFLVCLAFFG